MLFDFAKNTKMGGITFHNSGHRLSLGHVNDMRCLGKVSKGEKIRKRYNQVPHLTQDTNGKETNSQ